MSYEVQDRAYGLALSSIYDDLYCIKADIDACVGTLAAGVRSAAEYGVGTGRIAVPLAQRGIEVHGIDLSPDFLAVAALSAAAAGVEVELAQGDMVSWAPPGPVDLAYSVCASLTMLPDEDAVRRTLRSMAEAVRPGGRMVVENHHPPHVVALCAQTPDRIELEVEGLPGGVAMSPELGDGSWTALLEWSENGSPRQVLDRCLLLEPDRLAALAGEAGLKEAERAGGWLGEPLQAGHSVYISTFRRR